MAINSLRVAIVHDWLYGGGAERVIEELHRMYPAAPIYTSYCSDEWRKRLDGKVITGFLQHWPFNKLRKFLPVLRIWWFGRLDLSGFDLVISSSGNGEAFAVKTGPDTVHINYCHSPTHYYWRHYDLYMKQPGFGIFNPLVRLGLWLLVRPLRKWDYKAAQRADYHIANSTHIQKDIKKYYGRDAVVIHPPVDVKRFTVPEPSKREGFVIASRHVPQKKIDVAVRACNQLGLPLKVIGTGPETESLKKIAGPTVQFTGFIPENEVPKIVASAQAFIFPALDDFGVVPVEAMAAGTPVIAYKAGGALDYVQEGKTGLFFSEQTPESLAKALKSFDSKQFKPAGIRAFAATFSPEAFQKNMQQFVQSTLRRKK